MALLTDRKSGIGDVNGLKFCMVAGFFASLLYVVDKMADSGWLEGVIVQKSEPARDLGSLVLNSARKMRNLLWDPRKRQTAMLGALLPDFTDRHVLGKQGENKLRLLAQKHGFDLLVTESINTDTQIHNYLNNSKSQQALVLGGKILQPIVLNSFNGMWINCHGGLLPYYRGIYSEYWAIKKGDFEKIGWTIHELVERIDAGKIFQSGTVTYDPNETLGELMMRNHAAMITAYLHFANSLPDSVRNSLEHKPEKANYYSKPRVRAFRQLLRMKVSRL